MQTFTVYDGSAQPRRARGKHQVTFAMFAEQNRCWHYIPTPASCLGGWRTAARIRRAILTLADRGVFEVEDGCYRWRAH